MTPEQRNAAQELLLNRLIDMAIASVRTAIANPIGIHELLKSDDSEVLSTFREALSSYANELLDQLQALEVMQ